MHGDAAWDAARIEAARVAIRLPELDHQAGDLELSTNAFSDGFKRLIDLTPSEQAHHVIQHDSLALALLGLPSALTLACRKLACNCRGQEKEEQRYPLLWIGDGQLVERHDEEPVEHQKRDDGGENGWPAPKRDRGGHYGQQV